MPDPSYYFASGVAGNFAADTNGYFLGLVPLDFPQFHPVISQAPDPGKGTLDISSLGTIRLDATGASPDASLRIYIIHVPGTTLRLTWSCGHDPDPSFNFSFTTHIYPSLVHPQVPVNTFYATTADTQQYDLDLNAANPYAFYRFHLRLVNFITCPSGNDSFIHLNLSLIPTP